MALSSIFLCALVLLVGCTDPNAMERRLLLSELQEKESRHAQLTQSVSDRQTKTFRAEEHLKRLQAGLSDYEGRVEAFMMNHKMAVAALAAGAGGAAVAMDPENEFSDEARQMGGLVGAIGALYCISNFEECSRVGDQLVQSSARVKTLKAQIDSASVDLERETKLLLADEQERRTVQTSISSLRAKLRALE